MTAAMVVGMPYFAHAENFGTRFDEGTHLGSYYNVALKANTERVIGTVSYQKNQIPIQVKLKVARGNQLGYVYSMDELSSHAYYRSSSVTWLRNDRIGEAIATKSTNLINGSIIKILTMDMVDIPSAYIIQREDSEEIIQEPVIQEPVIQEPVIQEPVIQEPIIQEPVTQEP
ncbi:MAG: hypothetical protein RSC69_07160 [Lachnospiraceae bacterium]